MTHMRRIVLPAIGSTSGSISIDLWIDTDGETPRVLIEVAWS